MLRSSSRQAVILAVNSVITHFGMLEVFQGDNGPQFYSCVCELCQGSRFNHVTSSPGTASQIAVRHTVMAVKKVFARVMSVSWH